MMKTIDAIDIRLPRKKKKKKNREKTADSQVTQRQTIDVRNYVIPVKFKGPRTNPMV